jgi:hypothetical protein
VIHPFENVAPRSRNVVNRSTDGVDVKMRTKDGETKESFASRNARRGASASADGRVDSDRSSKNAVVVLVGDDFASKKAVHRVRD